MGKGVSTERPVTGSGVAVHSCPTSTATPATSTTRYSGGSQPSSCAMKKRVEIVTSESFRLRKWRHVFSWSTGSYLAEPFDHSTHRS